MPKPIYPTLNQFNQQLQHVLANQMQRREGSAFAIAEKKLALEKVWWSVWEGGVFSQEWASRAMYVCFQENG